MEALTSNPIDDDEDYDFTIFLIKLFTQLFKVESVLNQPFGAEARIAFMTLMRTLTRIAIGTRLVFLRMRHCLAFIVSFWDRSQIPIQPAIFSTVGLYTIHSVIREQSSLVMAKIQQVYDVVSGINTNEIAATSNYGFNVFGFGRLGQDFLMFPGDGTVTDFLDVAEIQIPPVDEGHLGRADDLHERGRLQARQ